MHCCSSGLSRIDPRTNSRRSCPSKFPSPPPLKSSSATTFAPCPARAEQRCDPMNPAPPVTSTFAPAKASLWTDCQRSSERCMAGVVLRGEAFVTAAVAMDEPAHRAAPRDYSIHSTRLLDQFNADHIVDVIHVGRIVSITATDRVGDTVG